MEGLQSEIDRLKAELEEERKSRELHELQLNEIRDQMHQEGARMFDWVRGRYEGAMNQKQKEVFKEWQLQLTLLESDLMDSQERSGLYGFTLLHQFLERLNKIMVDFWWSESGCTPVIVPETFVTDSQKRLNKGDGKLSGSMGITLKSDRVSPKQQAVIKKLRNLFDSSGCLQFPDNEECDSQELPISNLRISDQSINHELSDPLAKSLSSLKVSGSKPPSHLELDNGAPEVDAVGGWADDSECNDFLENTNIPGDKEQWNEESSSKLTRKIPRCLSQSIYYTTKFRRKRKILKREKSEKLQRKKQKMANQQSQVSSPPQSQISSPLQPRTSSPLQQPPQKLQPSSPEKFLASFQKSGVTESPSVLNQATTCAPKDNVDPSENSTHTLQTPLPALPMNQPSPQPKKKAAPLTASVHEDNVDPSENTTHTLQTSVPALPMNHQSPQPKKKAAPLTICDNVDLSESSTQSLQVPLPTSPMKKPETKAVPLMESAPEDNVDLSDSSTQSLQSPLPTSPMNKPKPKLKKKAAPLMACPPKDNVDLTDTESSTHSPQSPLPAFPTNKQKTKQKKNAAPLTTSSPKDNIDPSEGSTQTLQSPLPTFPTNKPKPKQKKESVPLIKPTLMNSQIQSIVAQFSKTVSKEKSLQKPEEVPKSDSVFQCNMCPSNYKVEEHLTTHILNVHERKGQSKTVPVQAPASEKIKCKKCGQSLAADKMPYHTPKCKPPPSDDPAPAECKAT